MTKNVFPKGGTFFVVFLDYLSLIPYHLDWSFATLILVFGGGY
jgi:hypothetical protein